VAENDPAYVLVTPVRNEENTIRATLESVIHQTVLPLEWIIVSDQSTDQTDRIVQEFAARHSFIRLLRLTDRPARSFASVVFVTESGLRALTRTEHEFIGLLDADVRFGSDYFEQLIGHFRRDVSLGMAGGLVVDLINGKRHRVGKSHRDVAGAVQFFRRKCFDALGGLVAIPEGGWDTITCVQVRMQGYRTRTIQDLVVDHLKPRNKAEGNLVQRLWKLGIREYALGNHPLFELLKCAYRCFQHPFLWGGVIRFAGFFCCYLTLRQRSLPRQLVEQIRREQLQRLHFLSQARDTLPHKMET